MSETMHACMCVMKSIPWKTYLSRVVKEQKPTEKHLKINSLNFFFLLWFLVVKFILVGQQRYPFLTRTKKVRNHT